MTATNNLAQTLFRLTREKPEQAAIRLLFAQAPELSLSYQELWARSAAYAQALAQTGVAPGEVVILILQHGPDLVAAFFGALLQGAIPSIMPFLTEKLLPDHYRRSLETLFAITLPGGVITYPEFLAEAEKAASQVSSIKAILVSDAIPPASDLNPDRFPGLQRSPDEIVLLQHSSGTTGLQKGVALSHQAIQNQLSSYANALHLSEDDVVVSWLPLYHDMGLIAGFILPVLSGLRLVLLSPFDWVRAPQKLLQAISAYQGSLCWLPNFAYNFCAQKIRARDLEGVNLSSLRAVINCSEPMSWKSQQMFLERFQPYGLSPEALATCYAMAENVFAVTQGGIDAAVTVDVIDAVAFSQRHIARPVRQAFPLNAPGSLKMLSAGRPIANTQVRVIGKHGQDLPERQVGEIVLQSNCMLAGYYHRPDLTQEAFLDGWYLTGDLGYLANGELFVTGRKKDLIIVGGKNVYPADIERLASDIKGVHPGRVVAFGVYDEELGTEEVALVAELEQFDQLSEADRERIQLHIRQRVSQGSDVVVRRVHVVGKNWLLKTSSGKIARGSNRDKYLAEIT